MEKYDPLRLNGKRLIQELGVIDAHGDSRQYFLYRLGLQAK